MFGYIQYNKDALSEDDFALYRSYYCGLCKSIKQLYGVKATRILSNDLTFIEVLLSALNEPLEEVVEEKCMVNPLLKVTTRINKYDSYEITYESQGNDLISAVGTYFKENEDYVLKRFNILNRH